MTDWADKARERWHTRAERRRPADAQAAYVAQWRAAHPNEVYGESWPCPLCGRVIQADPLPYRVREHQLRHAPDWERYQAAGADRASAGAEE